MRFSPGDYDKLIEILYRNPFITYKNIVDQFDNYSVGEIATLFREIRNEYITSDSIDAFLSNNSTPQDTILFINGALKSLFKDNIDQSNQLGFLFEEISGFYLAEEKKEGVAADPSYSVLYKYISALMLDKRLPKLSATESALVLALMFEVLNFSNEMFARKPEFTGEFCENIQQKLGQVLLKSVLSEDEWNDNNAQALIEAFNIPKVDPAELMRDAAEVNKKVQKHVALMSLNPFNISPSDVGIFKEVIDELIAEDNNEGRDVKKIFETLGINPNTTPLIVKVNDGDQLIVHKKALPSSISTAGGTFKMSKEEEMVEKNICERTSQHDIIDVDKFKKSLQPSEPKEKKRRLESDSI